LFRCRASERRRSSPPCSSASRSTCSIRRSRCAAVATRRRHSPSPRGRRERSGQPSVAAWKAARPRVAGVDRRVHRGVRVGQGAAQAALETRGGLVTGFNPRAAACDRAARQCHAAARPRAGGVRVISLRVRPPRSRECDDRLGLSERGLTVCAAGRARRPHARVRRRRTAQRLRPPARARSLSRPSDGHSAGRGAV
jgi:hypothetical protein